LTLIPKKQLFRTLSFSYGANGQVNASASLTGGTSISNGKITGTSGYVSSSQQFLKFGVAEQKVSMDLSNGNVEGIIGGGLGVSIDMIPLKGSVGLEKETIFVRLNIVDSAVYPMTYQEWQEFLGGK